MYVCMCIHVCSYLQLVSSSEAKLSVGFGDGCGGSWGVELGCPSSQYSSESGPPSAGFYFSLQTFRRWLNQCTMLLSWGLSWMTWSPLSMTASYYSRTLNSWAHQTIAVATTFVNFVEQPHLYGLQLPASPRTWNSVFAGLMAVHASNTQRPLLQVFFFFWPLRPHKFGGPRRYPRYLAHCCISLVQGTDWAYHLLYPW